MTISFPNDPQAFFLHLANYCDGPVTAVTLSFHADPVAFGWRISANYYPESRRLMRDHFYLTADPQMDRLIQLSIEGRIIEAVPGGIPGPDGDPPYRLCAGIMPDTDSRSNPLRLEDRHGA